MCLQERERRGRQVLLLGKAGIPGSDISTHKTRELQEATVVDDALEGMDKESRIHRCNILPLT